MSLVKKFLLSISLTLFLSNPLLASFGPDYDHRSAVGQINTYAGSGTATLVENDLLISAAHVFQEFLPNKKHLAQKSGPITIDLKNRGVVWQYQKHANGKRTDIPVLSMVVDAAYIHSSKSRDGLSENAEKNDVVFLKLDTRSKPAGIPTIPLVTQLRNLPLMCAAYGYGNQTGHERRRPTAIPANDKGGLADDRAYLIHKTQEIQDVAEKDVLRMDFQFNLPMGQDLTQAANEIRRLVYDKNANINRIFTNHLLETLPGDSGGPLFCATPQGLAILGIVSTCDESRYNGFASLMTGNRTYGYRLSPFVANLLNAIKGLTGGAAPQPGAPFNAKNYLKKYPHVMAEARKAKANPEVYAQEHYIKYKPFFPELSDKDEQPPFNAKRYLEKYPHVRAEAKQAKANPEAYAQVHYNKYKAFFPDLSDK